VPDPTDAATDPAHPPTPVGVRDCGANPARLLQAGDLQACLALDGAALGGFWSESQWRSELEGAGRLCLGINEPNPSAPGGLVGVACGWLVVDELHITVLAVHPASRRRGLGRQLLDALLAGARARGALHATLEVASGNQPALALYGACNFQTAGTRRGYYRDGQDALIQWKRISTAVSGLQERGAR
jgi:ribosomal-protein-alanine N-acetyltransferase